MGDRAMRAFTVGLLLAQLALVACVIEPSEVSNLAEDVSPIDMLEDAEQGIVDLLEEAESATALSEDDEYDDFQLGESDKKRAPAKKVRKAPAAKKAAKKAKKKAAAKAKKGRKLKRKLKAQKKKDKAKAKKKKKKAVAKAKKQTAKKVAKADDAGVKGAKARAANRIIRSEVRKRLA